jgi:hypothetical protein
VAPLAQPGHLAGGAGAPSARRRLALLSRQRWKEHYGSFTKDVAHIVLYRFRFRVPRNLLPKGGIEPPTHGFSGGGHTTPRKFPPHPCTSFYRTLACKRLHEHSRRTPLNPGIPRDDYTRITRGSQRLFRECRPRRFSGPSRVGKEGTLPNPIVIPKERTHFLLEASTDNVAMKTSWIDQQRPD